MTDEEKAIDLTSKSFELEKDKVEWFCKVYAYSRMSEIHTFYNGVLVGLAESRKAEKISELEEEKCKLLGIIQGKDEKIAELKAHCKAVDEVNKKLRCSGNCKHSYSVNTGGCYDTKCELTGCDCINCKDKWEFIK